jgi:hypothetical protein
MGERRLLEIIFGESFLFIVPVPPVVLLAVLYPFFV